MKTFQRPNFALYFQGDTQIFAELTKQDVLLLKSALTPQELSQVLVFHPSQREWVALDQNPEIADAAFDFQRNVKAPPPRVMVNPIGPNQAQGPANSARPSAANAKNPFAQNFYQPKSRPPIDPNQPPAHSPNQSSPGARPAAPGRPIAQPQGRPPTPFGQAASAPPPGRPAAVRPGANSGAPRPAVPQNQAPGQRPVSVQTPSAGAAKMPPPQEIPQPKSDVRAEETNPFHLLKKNSRRSKTKTESAASGSTGGNPLIPLTENENRKSPLKSTSSIVPSTGPFQGIDVRNRKLTVQTIKFLNYRAQIIALDVRRLQSSQKWPFDVDLPSTIQLNYLDQSYSLEGHVDSRVSTGDILILHPTKDYKYFLDLLQILGIT